MQISARYLSITCEPVPGAGVDQALRLLARWARQALNTEARCARHPDMAGLELCIGRRICMDLLGESAAVQVGLDSSLGPEGFVCVSQPAAGGGRVLVAGWTEQGTRQGVLHILRSLRPAPGGVVIDLPEQLRSIPAISWRGMYAHQHWSYHYPLALRTWSTEEWCRYVDLLGLMGFNLLQIWSMAETCPVPFSPADAAFLERYPPVIDHARQAHAMQVWIGACANNLARRDDRLPADRPYFDVETLLNPADPVDLERLRDHREQFYRLCHNADGYWVIDSDPGGWPGSPAEDFVEILQQDRRLIDTCTRAGVSAKLVFWMWFGWGKGTPAENHQRCVQLLTESMGDNLWLTHAGPEHFATTAGTALRDRALFFPYGVVEPEPSQPFTTIFPPLLCQAIETFRTAGPFAGMMGNAQSPLAQLPNIWYLARCMWDPAYAQRAPEETLDDLAALIFPQSAQALAQGWLALNSDDPAQIHQLQLRLDALLTTRRLGCPGVLGMLLFPTAERVVEDLLYLLRIHHSARVFVQTCSEQVATDTALACLLEYVGCSMDWRHRTGFGMFGYYGHDFEPVWRAAHARWGDRLPTEVVEALTNFVNSRSAPETGDLQLYVQPLCDDRKGSV